jgi:hypothetical protein
VVLTVIARNFQLPSNSDGAVESLAFLNALVYLPEVVLEVKGVVVEAGKADFDMKLFQSHLN